MLPPSATGRPPLWRPLVLRPRLAASLPFREALASLPETDETAVRYPLSHEPGGPGIPPGGPAPGGTGGELGAPGSTGGACPAPASAWPGRPPGTTLSATPSPVSELAPSAGGPEGALGLGVDDSQPDPPPAGADASTPSAGPAPPCES